MNQGDVYFFTTDKAFGHETRRKFHLYLGGGCWRCANAFMFINSADYGGDHPIDCQEYKFLDYNSFVGGLICYDDGELAQIGTPVGKLSRVFLGSLFHTVQKSETLEGWQIKVVCEALKGCAQ